MSTPSHSHRRQTPIGKYFLETGRISAEDLDRALRYKTEHNCKLGQALVALGLVSEVDLLQSLRTQGKFHCLHLTPGVIDSKVVGLLKEEDARRFRCLPINTIAGYTTVAMEDPTDVYAIDELAALLDTKILAVFAEPSMIREVAAEVYDTGGAIRMSSLSQRLEASLPLDSPSPSSLLRLSSADDWSPSEEVQQPSPAPAPSPPPDEFAAMVEALSGEPFVKPEDAGIPGLFDEPDPESPFVEEERVFQEEALASEHVDETPVGDAEEQVEEPALAELEEVESFEDEQVDSEVANTLRRLLAQAITESASDVHLEPRPDGMLVRFRVDGTLHERASVPRSWADPLIERVKEMADLGPGQGLPQEGRAQLSFQSQPVYLRIATTPTIHGEGAVVRILDGGEVRDLEDFGLSPEQLDTLLNAIQCRHGLVLATGPLRSGKTTMLYSILHRFTGSDTKIVSLEDPVERVVDGVTQINANPQAGFGFAEGFRSILFQDPDIVLLGHIPDKETARTVVQAATAGQLVLSNMHTFGAPEAVSRLVNRGVERHILADTLRVVIAQRLLRRICLSCRVAQSPDPRTLAYLDLEPSDNDFYVGSGCDDCDGSGYRGRIGIFEIMPVTPALSALIAKGASTEELSECARSEGMTNLRADGLEKARAGLTTLQEVLAATSHG